MAACEKRAQLPYRRSPRACLFHRRSGVALTKATPQFRLAVQIASAKPTPIIDAVEYFDLFFSIIVALGIVFQIPAVIFVLSRIGLVTATMLVRHFKHAMLACVVCAAVLTPTTDFGNMLVIAGPMIALYCVGIGVAWMFGKRV